MNASVEHENYRLSATKFKKKAISAVSLFYVYFRNFSISEANGFSGSGNMIFGIMGAKQ
ncbi:hypothetical protein RM553_10070 [Zunongwangia sp. F363]|uniref:Uncharacterized protein n=1 Tax=Autumnicola tepida TaxID=3075595 RepID=A0ABU3CA16_9FLAO|nr:hypothetical protein [Zunongwangia sp. F363]MDT0643174.1 hypothetical protein [Zunongwangia sp. F363]